MVTANKSMTNVWTLTQDLRAINGSNITKMDYNRMMCWNRNETLDHWLTKCMIFKILRDKGHVVIGECNFGGAGVVDLFSLTAKIVFDVEGSLTPSKKRAKYEQYINHAINDVIVIDLDKLPKDNKERFKYLKEKVCIYE